MRFVVVGAGAIGGTIAGRLHQIGSDVVVVARGSNFDALTQHGLTVESPESTEHLSIPCVDSVTKVGVSSDDVVVIAVKSQDTLGVVRDLAASAETGVAIVCAQNGLENERVALRYFPDVYGMCVMCPASHLAPGVVQIHCAPVSGVLDLGRWPGGRDDRASFIASTLERATFRSAALEDIATLKWGKLLSNIHNAIEALCGHDHETRELMRRVDDEAVRVLAAHGLDAAVARAALATCVTEVNYRPVGGTQRGGGSSWQSLARGTGTIETDYLNGEITLLGRLHAIPTPVNDMLQRTANAVARAHGAPGQFTESELLERVV